MDFKTLSAGGCLVALAVLTGCRTADEKLAAYFDRELYWSGRGTAMQLMTDRVISPQTEKSKQELFSPDEKKQTDARQNLRRLRDMIEFGKSWQVPEYELNPALAATAPVIDGKIGREEWKGTIEIPGSCRAGRRRRNFDGSRLLFKSDRNMLYIAAYFPLPDNGKNTRKLSKDDHVVIYFDTPGSDNPLYLEYVYFPDSGKTALSSWVYCGNGSSEKIADDLQIPEIKSAGSTTRYGYVLEMAVPRKLLRENHRGCCRIGILRWDTALEDYRTPAAIPYHGHDIFNRINLRLQ